MLVLEFPQIVAKFAGLTADLPRLLLVAGGRQPDSGWLKMAAAALNAPLWAVDRGIYACRRAAIRPIRLTGDADSAEESDWQWAETANVPIDRYACAKDRTDFQLALDLSRADFSKALLVATGAFGGRLDHAFSLLYSLANDGRPACMIDEREALFILRGSDFSRGETIIPAALTLEAASRPAVLSLLPLSAECRAVSLAGVRWPLENATLEQSLPYAVSNEPLPAENGAVKIAASVGAGTLGVYLNWGIE